MGKDTGISWTDATFNPWWGCTKVSPGCDNCYAETFDRRVGGDHWGKNKPRREFKDSHWQEPLNWNKAAEKDHVKLKVFCASMADVMDDEAPPGARESLFELIDDTPHLIWQLLTKRAQRYHRYLPKAGFKHKNVWLGTSAEDQTFYDVRWPYLRMIARELGLITFISYEPALGPLSINQWVTKLCSNRRPPDPQGKMFVQPEPTVARMVPDWIIMGGESGHGRRRMEQKWAEDLRKECEMWEVSFWMKQMSARTPAEGAALIPAHLLVRQFPSEGNDAT